LAARAQLATDRRRVARLYPFLENDTEVMTRVTAFREGLEMLGLAAIGAHIMLENARATPTRTPSSHACGKVLTLVARGKSAKGIALILKISPRTVGVHMAAFVRKLSVENRLQAVAIAVRRGLMAREH